MVGIQNENEKHKQTAGKPPKPPQPLKVTHGLM